MTSCIVGKKIRAMGPGPLELFPFVVLAILMAMARGISEHMLIFSFFKHMIKRIHSTRSTMSKLDKLYFQLQEYD